MCHSYVCATETGLYYLQSRYYDPKVGRFLNADALVSTGQGILGNNMFAYCNNNQIIYYDPRGTFTLAVATGYDITFGFVGVSASFSFVLDDDWNIAIQASYSLPTYMDSESYHTGMADAGIAISAQVTDDDTIYNLEGPGSYAGFSAGAGPSFGVDMVYSGVEALNDAHTQELPNGISASVGFGVGIDAHFKQTNTSTLWAMNLKEWFACHWVKTGFSRP